MQQNPKKILILFPYNQRTVEQQSVMEMLVKKGHNVFLVTLSPRNKLHEIATALGVTCFSTNTGETLSIKNLIANAKFLIRFCKEHKIDLILAHQQVCALPLIFAKPFLQCPVYYVRHNTDEGYAANPLKAKLLNRFINSMSKNIIAPSGAVYKYLVEKEKVTRNKITRINYGYNFSQYNLPDENGVSEIKKQYPCRFLVISIARLAPPKRHIQMFGIIQQLLAHNLDIKMVCLGGGPLQKELEQWITVNNLQDNIFLVGIQPNVMDYLQAADLLLHLSETEASNSVVKEAGLAQKPVIVCENVGDFSDYIVHEKNGFLVIKEDPAGPALDILLKYYHLPGELKKIGSRFSDTVVQDFDINRVAGDYDTIINSVKK